MMLPLLLALQAAAPAPGVDGSPLGVLPRQQLPATGCAAFLWSVGARHELVAMASADAGRLRVSLDGRILDLARGEQAGVASFGFAGTTHYRAGDVDVTLDLTVGTDPGLTQGGTVPTATLTVLRPGGDGAVLPVAGLIGCASPHVPGE